MTLFPPVSNLETKFHIFPHCDGVTNGNHRLFGLGRIVGDDPPLPIVGTHHPMLDFGSTGGAAVTQVSPGRPEVTIHNGP